MGSQLTGEKTYYIYRHIRTDKNEPFYIGKGTVNTDAKTEKAQYWRAHGKSQRTNFWKKVVSKTSYDVEILFQSEDLKLILDKESEFIKIYGRRDLGLGPLVNLTDGGEANSGRPSPPNIVTVFAYKIDGEFYKEYKSFTDCAKDLGLEPRTVSEIANRKDELGKKPRQKSSGGFMFFLDFRGDKTEEMKKNVSKPSTRKGLILGPKSEDVRKKMSISKKAKYAESATPVFAYLQTGEFFKEYSSSARAADDIGALSGNIQKSIKTNEGLKRFAHIKGLIFFETYKGDKINRVSTNNRVLIIQYDEDLNYIQSFSSASHAEKVLGIGRQTILKYLRNGLPFNGLIFKSN